MSASTSSTAAPRVPTAAIRAPVYKPEEYTTAGIILKFFDDKAKDIAKTLGYTGFWLGQAIPGLPPEVKSFSGTMGDIKNFVGATEVPKKVVEASQAYSALSEAISTGVRVNEAGRKAVTKTTSLVNSLADGANLGSKFLPVDTSVMEKLNAVNSAATLTGSSIGAYEQYEKYQNAAAANETTKAHFYGINFFRDLAYASVGAYGLACFVTATAVVPWIMIGMLTAGLALTIFGYFYEKSYDPEGTGKNLNPDVVIANQIAKRQYQAQVAATRRTARV
jgi:hypothetical protein